jgi:hypothetical protein
MRSDNNPKLQGEKAKRVKKYNTIRRDQIQPF